MSDVALFPLWDPTVPFPSPEAMEDLSVVTHVLVDRAQPDGYHYLHESALAWHHGALHLGWANHRTAEVNVKDELLRGTRSVDGGLTWEPPRTWVEPPANGSDSYNHPVLHSDGERLWGFFTRWDNCHPSTEVFQLDEEADQWRSQGVRIRDFVPFRPPLKLRDGNWILGGELFWYEAAVAISRGDDLTCWDTVKLPRPTELELQFPETALVDQGDRLLAICRPKRTATAPVASSEDCGRTWTTLALSNFPLTSSQPYAGLLSTGQHYLITCNREEGRALLSIAVTAPGGRTFQRIWKLRHQQFPRRRLFGGWGQGSNVGHPTEWSYPAAIEHDGQLYVSYTHGKEDCVFSIIPLRALAV